MNLQMTSLERFYHNSLTWFSANTTRIQFVFFVVAVVSAIIAAVTGDPAGIPVAPGAGGGSGGNT